MNNLKTYETQGNEFYSLMGPLFANKEYIKELDNQLYNEANTTWILCVEGDKVKGCISIQDKEKHYYIDNFLVMKEFRGSNIGGELLNEAIKKYADKPIKIITRNEIALGMFIKHKFISYRKNGRYYYLEKSI